MLRSIAFFVVGFLLAYAIYLAGGWDRLSAYWAGRYDEAMGNPPPSISSPPPVYPAPLATPPSSGVEPLGGVLPLPTCAPGQQPPGCDPVPGPSVAATPLNPQSDDDEEDEDEGASDRADVSGDQDDQDTPPPPNSNGASGRDDSMLAIRLSTRERYAEAPGCSPAYTIVNDTHQPIVLKKGRRHRHLHHRDDWDDDDRGWRHREHHRRAGKAIVRPGESEVVCAERRSYRRFDYYSPHPDADIPPEEAEFVARTVKIRLKD